MSNHKTRITKLEAQQPQGQTIANLKPSEILARVDELLATARQRKAADGGEVVLPDEIARRIGALRWMVTHEQP